MARLAEHVQETARVLRSKNLPPLRSHFYTGADLRGIIPPRGRQCQGRDGGRGQARLSLATTYLRADSQVGFQVAAYDAGQPMVIDPVLSYSTYLGGSDGAAGSAMAVDASGNAYIRATASTNFPHGTVK